MTVAGGIGCGAPRAPPPGGVLAGGVLAGGVLAGEAVVVTAAPEGEDWLSFPSPSQPNRATPTTMQRRERETEERESFMT
jgi:hypothetical protein